MSRKTARAKTRPKAAAAPAAARRAGPRHSAVTRALGLLRRLALDGGDASLKDLGAAENLPPDVAYKLLKLLVAEGFAAYDAERKRYRAGVELVRLAALIVQQVSFVQVARSIMRELVAESGESTCLNLRDPKRDLFTVAAVEESRAPLQYVIDLGQLHPLHAGASGKAILAFLPDRTIDRILKLRLDSVTGRTVTDPVQLRFQIAEIRKQGYCISFGERLDGAVGIAAPVRDPGGEVVGSVQVTIPKQRFDPARADHFAGLVLHAAERITGLSALAHGEEAAGARGRG